MSLLFLLIPNRVHMASERGYCLEIWATVSNNGKESYCVYDKDIATGLGVGSFLFLLLGQILIMVASRCLCCGKAMKPSGSRAWAVVLFITCWVFFLIAEVCLLAGSVRNAYHTKYKNLLDNPPSCATLRKGVFGAGAAFVFLTAVVSELYYVSYSKAARDEKPNNYGRDTGVRMGNL
ncbi:DnaJ subfamily C member 22 [Gossypium australe]|uniref:DnaJ subfamily C member 22 n=1 Tax=Gossypium australe TaxID=47621 RepID=A0A5B6WBD2_9ROSI|nr:DnaJ subfamily C member 22 [Gossypium australe]